MDDPDFSGVTFERDADDAVVDCTSQAQACTIRAAIEDRMVEVGLRLHPDKTRIVYCQDSNRRGSFELTSFTFLGFTFRARKAMNNTGSVSPRSYRRSVQTPYGRSAGRFASGGCTDGSPSPSWPA